MESALKLIFDIIIWVFVPLILITAIFLISSLSKKMADKKYQASVRAGFWAGFFLFIIIFVYQISIFLKSGFPNQPIFQGFNLWLALAGGATAFGLSLEERHIIISPKWSGWVILILTFTCFYGLFHYLFIRAYNELIISSILGVTFGILTHIASSPSLVHEFITFLKSNH